MSKSNKGKNVGKKDAQQSQKLDPKYQNILDKSVIGSYEKEKFEFAIKEADRILKQYPTHGETLAMKGLCTHCVALQREGLIKEGKTVKQNGKEWKIKDSKELKSEGLKLINDGLKYNLNSSISWRVKGLVHKAEKDYDNAVRSLKRALNFDTRNKTIMNDISQILTQLRNYNEFKKIRKELWNLDQTQSNAVAFLFSLYLNNDFEECSNFLDTFLTDYPKIANFEPVALNEICLFKAKLLNKLEKYDECIEYIDEKLKLNEIKDELQALTIKKNVLNNLKRYNESLTVLKKLIDINPENSAFLREYITVQKQITTNKDKNGNETANPNENENENEKKHNGDSTSQLFDNLSKKYPKSATIERMYLEYATGNEFRTRIDAYLRKKFKKSVISLYTDIKSLYNDNEKATILNELIESYVQNLKDGNRFNSSNEKNSASPSCLLWVNYFRASRMLDCKQFMEALEVVNDALEWVPTCIDLYVLKARIYKYGGNAGEAFVLLNKAREMDTADRFLNTKCTRYALRAGNTSKAEEIVRMLLKTNDGVKVLQTLQVMWYELHKAECHIFELNEYAPGLRELEHVWSHFEKFWDSQIDFQGYVYRKVSVTAYLALVAWEDEIRNHPFFVRAAIGAVTTYIKIYNTQKEYDFDLTNKDYLNIVLKGSIADSKLDSNIKRSADALGWDLMNNLETPLNDATRWMNFLIKVDKFNNDSDYDVINSLNIELSLLKKEFEQCANAIKQCLDNKSRTMQENPKIFAQTVCALKSLQEEKLDKETETTVKSVKSEFFKDNIDEFVTEYFVNSTEMKQMTAIAYCISKGKISNVSLSDVSTKMIGAPATITDFREARKLLLQINKDDPVIPKIETKFLETYPLCTL